MVSVIAMVEPQKSSARKDLGKQCKESYTFVDIFWNWLKYEGMLFSARWVSAAFPAYRGFHPEVVLWDGWGESEK